MATVFKNLGKGQMPTSLTGVSPQVVTGKSVMIESIIFVNRHVSAPATLTLYVRRSSVDTLVMSQSISSGVRLAWNHPIALNALDTLVGLSTATPVDFLISGVEKDI